MKATYILKKELVQFMLSELVTKYNTSFQSLIDVLIDKNIKIRNKNSIGFKSNGNVFIHSTIKDQFKSAFSIMELRKSDKISELHPSLHEEVQQIHQMHLSSKIEEARCLSFINYCVSLGNTSTELKLIIEYVGLSSTLVSFEKSTGTVLYDDKDELKSITPYVKSKLDVRVAAFQQFLDKLNVMKNLLGI